MNHLLTQPEVLTTFVAAITALTWALANYFKARSTPPRFRQTIQAVNTIWVSLDGLIQATGADRVQVLRVTNGGSLMRPGDKMTSSVAYEVNRDGVPGYFQEWQDRLLSIDCQRLLHSVYFHGPAWIKPEQMPNTQIADKYAVFGVVTSYLIRVHEAPNALFYLELHFSEEVVEDSAFRDRVRDAVATLKPALQEGDHLE